MKPYTINNEDAATLYEWLTCYPELSRDRRLCRLMIGEAVAVKIFGLLDRSYTKCGIIEPSRPIMKAA